MPQFDKPLINSYWVRPGRLLAGEYPLLEDEQASAQRLQYLLRAGMNHFIDLTAVGELPAYRPQLPARFNNQPVIHQRFTITDHDIPTPARMSEILDALDAALAAGGGVYVHCRAGIGRTGTVIGCFLVRHGHDGIAAIEELNSLWQACGRAASWPNVPETDAQETFIRNFKATTPTLPAPAAVSARLGVYQGALLGLAIGDALGATRPAHAVVNAAELAEFNNLFAIQWGADTAMSLALADSLLHCNQMQPEDQMRRYLAWQKQGRYSSDGQPGNLPVLVQKALGLWQWKRNPQAGSHDPTLLDAHPLARCTPVTLYFAKHPPLALRAAAESARTTLQAPLALDACRVFAALLLAIVEGVPAPQVFEFKQGRACSELRSLPLKPEWVNLIDGGWRTAMTHPAGTDVLSVLAGAVHAVATTTDFHTAIFKAMQRAAQPATVAAVCGALAGALYGAQGLPIVWRETLPKANELLLLSERLLMAAPAP